MNLMQKTCALLTVLVMPGLLQAGELPNTENMSGLQFNFSAPGARSLGMGGAFLGRADDSTAAYANPAGLTNLFSAELSAEWRFNNYDTPYTSGGEYPDNLTRDKSRSSANNFSYLSFVYPAERWVFAAYRHQLMDFNNEQEISGINLGDDESSNPVIQEPVVYNMNVEIVNYGFSTAFRVNDRISLGATVSYFDFKMNAGNARFIGDIFESRQNQSGRDNEWGFTLGALFSATDSLSIGLVYRSSPEFDSTFEQKYANFNISGLDFERPFQFEVPDSYGIGVSFQPSDNWTINFDVMRILYSDVADPVFWAFYEEEFLFDWEKDIVDGMSIDDGTEFHLGAEYVMTNQPIALRVGLWTDPDHFLVDNAGPYDREISDDDFDEDRARRQNDAFFQGGKNQTHISMGIGIFFDNFQMDFAADFSSYQDIVSISGVYRFN